MTFGTDFVAGVVVDFAVHFLNRIGDFRTFFLPSEVATQANRAAVGFDAVADHDGFGRFCTVSIHNGLHNVHIGFPDVAFVHNQLVAQLGNQLVAVSVITAARYLQGSFFELHFAVDVFGRAVGAANQSVQQIQGEVHIRHTGNRTRSGRIGIQNELRACGFGFAHRGDDAFVHFVAFVILFGNVMADFRVDFFQAFAFFGGFAFIAQFRRFSDDVREVMETGVAFRVVANAVVQLVFFQAAAFSQFFDTFIPRHTPVVEIVGDGVVNVADNQFYGFLFVAHKNLSSKNGYL